MAVRLCTVCLDVRRCLPVPVLSLHVHSWAHLLSSAHCPLVRSLSHRSSHRLSSSHRLIPLPFFNPLVGGGGVVLHLPSADTYDLVLSTTDGAALLLPVRYAIKLCQCPACGDRDTVSCILVRWAARWLRAGGGDYVSGCVRVEATMSMAARWLRASGGDNVKSGQQALHA